MSWNYWCSTTSSERDFVGTNSPEVLAGLDSHLRHSSFEEAWDELWSVVVCGWCQSTSSVLDGDTQYHWLSMMRLLCIHGNCLDQSAADEMAFVQYCLKYLMVPRYTLNTSLSLLPHSITVKHFVEPGFRQTSDASWMQTKIGKKQEATNIKSYYSFYHLHVIFWMNLIIMMLIYLKLSYYC